MKARPAVRQYAAAISATVIAAAAGTTVGWTSPTLPYLLGPSSHIPITPDQSSWITSLMILVSALSPLPAAYMADAIGRKWTLILAALPYLLGWLNIVEARSVLALYTGRMVQGLGYGIVYTTAPMYLGEIASDSLRGSMATFITVMSKVGILTQYSVGPFVSFSTLVWVNVSLPIIFVLSFVLMPESPYYLLKRGRKGRAEKSMEFLRGRVDRIELSCMEKLVDEDTEKEGRWRDVVKSKGNKKALCIILGVYATQQLCGSTAIISYAQQIFGRTGSGLGPDFACIVLGVVQLVTTVTSSLLVDKVGRKPLLLVSSLGVGVSDLVVGGYFVAQRFQLDLTVVGWLPLVAITTFICSYTIGLATVPFAITSEMFPTNVKSKATCVVQTFVAVATFAVTKMYQVVADNLGTDIIFLIFGAFSFAGLVFVWTLLPEMKGQSFEAIQNRLNVSKTTTEHDP